MPPGGAAGSHRRGILQVLLGLATLAVARTGWAQAVTAAKGGQVYVQPDSLGSGLVTTPMLDGEQPALRVSWVRWHSTFRETGLQVGDEVIAINGEPMSKLAATEADRKRIFQGAGLGQYAETQVWKAKGLKEGAPLSLTVRRRALPQGWQTLQFAASLRLQRTFENADRRRTFGPDGPEEMRSDGLGESWSGWLEKWERFGTQLRDGGWRRGSFSTDGSRSELQQAEARLQWLTKSHPDSAFTRAIRQDFEALRALIDGGVYHLTADDLAYRKADEIRAAEVAEHGKRAREVFLAGLGQDRLETLPKIDLLGADRDRIIGKVLVLPPIPPRNWVTEATHNWFAAQIGPVHCFVDTQRAAAQRMQIAARRYTRRVTPNLREDYAIIGRIKPEPRLVIVNGRGLIGLELEPIAATVGDAMFVDLTKEEKGQSPFAGEAELARAQSPPPPDDASPRVVLEASFKALKAGDQTLWQSLFVGWRATGGKPPIYYAYKSRSLDEPWVRARRALQERICDLRVVWVDDAQVAIRGDEYPGLPRVEEVQAEVEHVREVQTPTGVTYRGYMVPGWTRTWRLQRVDSGPWRIMGESGI